MSEIEDEIKNAFREVLAELPPPEKVEFPDVQQVEITNLPEPPEPPKIEIPKVDLSGLENAIREFLNKKQEVTPATDLTEVENLLESVIAGLKEIPKPETVDHTELLSKVLELL